jgi:hypothetical protein
MSVIAPRLALETEQGRQLFATTAQVLVLAQPNLEQLYLLASPRRHQCGGASPFWLPPYS